MQIGKRIDNLHNLMILSELMKGAFNRGDRPALSFWRDSNGNEVDVIIDTGTKLMPIEIKSGKTINRDFFTGIERWMALAGDRVAAPSLVYGGGERLQHKGIHISGWRSVHELLERQT